MDRETLLRALLAGAIVIAVMWAWPHITGYFWPAPEPAAPPAQAPATPGEKPPAQAPATPGEKPPAPGEKPPGETPAAPPSVKAPDLVAVGAADTEAAPIVLGSATVESLYDLEAEVDPRGASVKRLTLARHAFYKTVEDRQLPPNERAAMDLVDAAAPHPAFLIPELRLKMKGVDGWAKVDLSDVVWKVDPAPADADSVALSVDIQEADGKALLAVRKTFTLKPRAPDRQTVPQYELAMRLEAASADARVEKVMYVLGGTAALGREDKRQDFRAAVFGKWVEGRVKIESLAGSAIKKADGAPAGAPPTKTAAGPEVAWLGQVDKYFAVLLIPQTPSPEGTFAGGAEAVQYKVTEHRKPVDLPDVRLLSRELPIAPDQPITNTVTLFAGPKDPKHLEAYYAHLGMDGLVQWGSCCGIPGIETISRILLAVIDAFYSLVENYGVAIIMLVVVLRVVLLPVTKWSAKSMAQMQALQPKMQKIKEEFAHDQKRMQEEMAKIGGLKAMGGCLPMFVQMPIWVGLYGALLAAIQLRHSAFLPTSWVPAGSNFLQDLAAPDALVSWQTPFYLPGQDIPLLGSLIGYIQGMLGGGITSFNLLPILMAGVMFAQQKMTPTSAAGPQAEQQKKMMLFMMLFFALILYAAPSGLCLYILTSSLLGFAENRFFRNRWVEAAKAKAEEGAKAPPGEVKPQSLITGREKSLGERAEAWLRQRFGSPPEKEGGPKKGKKRKR